MKQRFPMPIPYGWFFVHYAADLAPGEVKALHYFDEDLVLFRGTDGEIGLLDAYCPHLGAHLGKGGRAVEGGIQCPFHAWEFDARGFCTKIPYAKTMIPRARREPLTRAYPVVERDGVIWAWYHPEGIAPTFEVLEHPEFTDPAFDQLRREWTFASNPQEIAENGVDVAHFQYVHTMVAVPEGKTEYDGHIRRSRADGHREIPNPDGTVRLHPYSVSTVQNGAGQKNTRLKGLVELSLAVLATPVDAENVELRFCFAWPAVPQDSPQYQAIQQAIANTCGQSGVEGDIPIWHNKIHRERPILCDSDGPILRFRRYFEQFYLDYRSPSHLADDG